MAWEAKEMGGQGRRWEENRAAEVWETRGRDTCQLAREREEEEGSGRPAGLAWGKRWREAARQKRVQVEVYLQRQAIVQAAGTKGQNK